MATGAYAYRMKRPLPDGRTHLVLGGVELLRKLAPLIPPPRLHLLRFHGVFAPEREAALARGAQAARAARSRWTRRRTKPKPRPSSSPYRLDWAAALKRVFGTDLLKCVRCGGRLVILAFIEKRSAVKAILEHLGLPSVPLPLAVARGPPQAAWDF